jgi:hypothetical protein
MKNSLLETRGRCTIWNQSENRGLMGASYDPDPEMRA